jgi:uncharacterized membrane protein
MVKRKTARVNIVKDGDDLKLHAFIATFFSIIGFIVALIAWNKEEYTMFYARQSIVIFIIAIFAQIISLAVNWIYAIGHAINFLLWVFVILLWLLSWVYALSKEEKEVPFIGYLGSKLKL